MNFAKFKYIDLFISIILISGLILLFFNYDYWVHSDFSLSGRAAKKTRAFLLILDRSVGKLFTMIALTMLISPFIYSTFSKLLKGEINSDIKKTPLKKGDVFTIKGKEIHVTNVNSTLKGHSGSGWFETGIFNKLKEEITFKNVEIDDNYAAQKGEIITVPIPESTSEDIATKDEKLLEKPFDHYNRCPACGYKLKETDKECPDCGLSLS
jgi:hypothetical protein